MISVNIEFFHNADKVYARVAAEDSATNAEVYYDYDADEMCGTCEADFVNDAKLSKVLSDAVSEVLDELITQITED